MSARRKMEKRAAELGATIEIHEGWLNVDSPRGMVWRETGSSTLVLDLNAPDNPPRAAIYFDALEQMEAGLEPAPWSGDYWWAE